MPRRINPKPSTKTHSQKREHHHAERKYQRQRRTPRRRDFAQTREKPSLEQALDQIEFVKGSLRGAVTNLNNLADTLRQVQRERRLSEREIRSVRGTLKALQTVRL